MRSCRKHRGILFIISGPSGSGKTTLAQRLLGRPKFKGMLFKSRSLTTRPKRSAEKQNRDYCFISSKDFFQRLRSKKILEWTSYLGYYYATPKDLIERQLKGGKHILLCLDFKGARRLKRLYPENSVTVFIIPPSIKELTRRIKQRCRKAKAEEIERRVALAQKELLDAGQYDYRVVNKRLPQALNDLEEIVLKEINNRGEG